MVDIFDEVADDLRAERAMRLARRYGGLLILGCLLVLLGVAAQQVYLWHEGKRNEAAAAAFLRITGPMDAQGGTVPGNEVTKDATALTDFAATAPEGYKTLANLRAAALYANGGQEMQAEALWTNIADDAAAEPMLRDLATLLWAQHALGTVPGADVLARLKPLTGPKNPYHGLAQETQALVYLHEGKIDLAKALFSQIAADPDAPDGARNRADGLLAKLNG
ncbi:MAG: tetratricopeptide repeat protein [Acidocella sp.]|nr:tetratricopeptide repeat protein [Acidocella sp.]